jgi:predicted AAA+ superfamily ATPase
MQLLVALLRERVGSPVVISNLAEDLQVSPVTVKKWIEILESMDVIFQGRPYSRPMPRALQKQPKIYFYDNGIRNVIINNLNPLELRVDKGALWENFLISERIKKNNYTHQYANHYFWRNTQKQEIDYVEEKNGKIEAFEFKWNSKGKNKIPASFVKQYHARGTVVDKANYRDFIM